VRHRVGHGRCGARRGGAQRGGRQAARQRHHRKLPGRGAGMTRPAGLVLALGVVGLVAGDGAATVPGDAALRPRFTEAAWPYLLDPWGPGRAYRCGAEQCGQEIRFTVRPKSGFCNCYNGVADDDEIDRIGDVDLHSPNFVPLAPGAPAKLAAMDGRTRAFRVDSGRGPRRVAAIVVASNCNALVATIASEREPAPVVERAVFNLLEGAPVQNFIAAASVSP